jgi:D-alanine-D-alanine ligase
MRVLIIANPSEPGKGIEERFAHLASVLAERGLETECVPALSLEALKSRLASKRPDLVYAAPYWTADEPGYRKPMQEALARSGIATVGSPESTLALALDKAALKRRWAERGVRTPGWLEFSADCVRSGAARVEMDKAREFPDIVKPSKEGNSRGIGEDSVVRDPVALRERVEYAARTWGDVLVERFLGDDLGIREFTAAWVGNGRHALVMPAEIRFKIPKAVRVISNGDKDEHRTLATALEPGAERDRVSSFARRAFEAAGIEDYARGDFLMSGGELYAIEVNGQAMIPDRWFEACAKGSGLGDERYLAALFLAAIERCRAAGFPLPETPERLRAPFSDEELERLGAAR